MLNHVFLESIAYELPPYVISSDSIVERLEPAAVRFGLDVGAVMAASGVEERRFWAPAATMVSAGAVAARKAIERSGIDPNEIGALVSTSVCKDYIEPSMASLIHGELGLGPSCLNLDVGNACLGFLNGIALVADLIELGRIRAAVVVDAESSREVVEATIERLLSDQARRQDFHLNFATLTLGSGAVAVVMAHSSLSQKRHRLVGHVSLADTVHRHLCLGSPQQMLVHAQQLLEAGLLLARQTWGMAQRLLGWSSANLDFIIGHQVGARHFRCLLELFGLDSRRTFVTYPFLGNVGPASLPLTLAIAVERGVIRPGYRLALMGIGSGLNCSMMELEW
ncbi:MAG: 3-oxoacyl-ACP synthase III [Vulcanimicrobiota bacterium]